MKNAMKKLMAFVLVAVMLVGALPFAAFADTVEPFQINLSVTESNGKALFSKSMTETVTGLTVAQYLSVQWDSNWASKFSFAEVKFNNYSLGANDKAIDTGDIAADRSVKIDVILSCKHVNTNVAAATCTTAKICSDCGETLNAATGQHDWNDATCTAPKTCKNCSATEGQALGHAYASDIACAAARPCTRCTHVEPAGSCDWADATCTTPQTCRSCGATQGEALNHNPNVENATCTVAKICTRCNTQLAPMADHTPNNAAATCTTAKVCTVCYEVLADALGHNPGTNGVCTRCNETVGNKHVVSFYPNYNTNNTPTVKGVYEGTNAYAIYTPSRYGYTFDGWYYDAGLTRAVPSTATITGDVNFYAKWKQVAPKEVYVRVYANGNTNNVYAIVDLYEWAQDHVITKADIEAAVAKYGIKANNKAGLSTYGPFTPAQWNSYCLDDYYRNPTERVDVDQDEKTVIYAMVHNVKTSSSSSSGNKADSSNPKTGDMIFAPMMVLGVSASALAALYYISKKRAI